MTNRQNAEKNENIFTRQVDCKGHGNSAEHVGPIGDNRGWVFDESLVQYVILPNRFLRDVDNDGDNLKKTLTPPFPSFLPTNNIFVRTITNH